MATFWFNNSPPLRNALSSAAEPMRRAQQVQPGHHLSLSRLLQLPGFVRFAVLIDRAPEWLWLALLAAALWPTFWWMGQRMVDGSDDPLGLLALATLGAVVWVHRRALRAAPRLGWLALAMAGTLAATAMRAHLPDLASALIALLSLAAALVAFLPARVAVAPVLGLSVLSLPLLASLQFYAGYPLRVVTAEASRWLLALTHDVSRSGSSLQVNGHLVMVDAPCSGVQMVWLGYFTACGVALYAQHVNRGPANGIHQNSMFSSRTFLTRLPAVSALVLLGNVVRNTVLVAAEASGGYLPGWAHDAVGLLVLAAVCGGIGWVMGRAAPSQTQSVLRAASGSVSGTNSMWPILRTRLPTNMFANRFINRFINRVLHKTLLALLLPLCLLWSVAQAFNQGQQLSGAALNSAATASPELPTHWNGAPLRPLALSEVEHRFTRRFPGTITRMTDGEQVLVLRTVHQPTRMLHPAADCYKGLGYRIHGEQLETLSGITQLKHRAGPAADKENGPRLQRCFIAERAGRQVRVCEHIADAHGQSFTDTSAWYWAAVAGQSIGPWQAIAVARAL